jgi:hypothetical protein
MLPNPPLIIKDIRTNKEQILDARKGGVEGARVIVVYMAKSNSSLFELCSIGLL